MQLLHLKKDYSKCNLAHKTCATASVMYFIKLGPEDYSKLNVPHKTRTNIPT